MRDNKYKESEIDFCPSNTLVEYLKTTDTCYILTSCGFFKPWI